MLLFKSFFVVYRTNIAMKTLQNGKKRFIRTDPKKNALSLGIVVLARFHNANVRRGKFGNIKVCLVSFHASGKLAPVGSIGTHRAPHL